MNYIEAALRVRLVFRLFRSVREYTSEYKI